MSNYYQIDIIELRRNIKESCDELFKNKDLADIAYVEIMNPLEDFMSENKVNINERLHKAI